VNTRLEEAKENMVYKPNITMKSGCLQLNTSSPHSTLRQLTQQQAP
jgi:hypothetical protein